ncbi:hypothetical protein HPB47_019102, partial [Ixodes persulcatus]
RCRFLSFPLPGNLLSLGNSTGRCSEITWWLGDATPTDLLGEGRTASLLHAFEDALSGATERTNCPHEDTHCA